MAERSFQELTPWLVPLNSRIVACKDSSLLAVYEYTGLDGDGAGDGAVKQLELLMDAAMRAWRNQPVVLWWTMRREKTADYPGVPMPDAVAQMLDDEQRTIFVERGGYVNRYFVSVAWQPRRNTDTVLQRIGEFTADGMSFPVAIWRGLRSLLSTRESFGWRAAELEQTLTSYESLLSQFAGTLAPMGMRRLSGADLTGALWAFANPGLPMAPKALPTDGRMLDALLPERTLDVTRDALVLDQGTSNEAYLSAVSLKAFPSEFPAGALDAALTAPCAAIYTVAFRVGNNVATAKRVSTARTMANLTRFPVKAMIAGAFRHGDVNEQQADPAKAELLDEASEVTGELSSGRRYFGWLNATLCYLHPDYAELNRITNEMLQRLRSEMFAGAVRESIHLASAWTVTLPGAWEECRRWYYMSDANCADLAPIISVVSGERENAHFSEQFGGHQPALTVLPTDRNTPYYFNFHSGQSSHTFVVGPTRSGKSTGMNFLISQWRKYPNARIFIFDRDHSCRIPTLLQGGSAIDLKADGSTRLNPVALAADATQRPFVAHWIEGLIAAHGHDVSASESQVIWEAVSSVGSDADAGNRRLTGIYTQLPGALRDQLAPWIEGHEHGALFDHAEDALDLSAFACVEMGSIMSQPVVAAALMDYLFHRIDQALRPAPGEALYPTLLYVEEASFLLQVPAFASRLVDWLKTFAKLNGTVVLTTQSPEDYTDAAIARTFAAIRDNVTTRIYLPNPNATSASLKEIYTKVFQLRPEQVDRIATALPQREYFLVKPGVARMVNLRLSPKQVAALRSDAKAQRLFDTYYQAGQAEPGWQSRYLKAIAS